MSADNWQHLNDLGPFAILLAALVALAGVVYATRVQAKQHRTELEQLKSQHGAQLLAIKGQAGDEKRDRAAAQWWDRTTWALGLCISTRAVEREIGNLLIPHVATSALAGQEELRIIEAVIVRLLADRGGPTE